MKRCLYYVIMFKNSVINNSDVVGDNIETGKLGIYSGLFANQKVFTNKAAANKAMKNLENDGHDISKLEIVRLA